MFKNLSDFTTSGAALMPDDSGALSEKEMYVSVIAILLKMASIDRSISADETNAIVGSMFRAFSLADEVSRELIEVAEHLSRTPGRVENFIVALNQQSSAVQREELLSYVWRVLISDRKAQRDETALAVELRKQLGLTLEQAVRARQMAELYEKERSALATANREGGDEHKD